MSSGDELAINLTGHSQTEEENENKFLCGICHRQFARYTCPSCNLAYCSLACFRSEAHSQCSETFYRKELESDVHSHPSAKAEERMKMLEMLKRLEQESVDTDGQLVSPDDEEDLASRLTNINLETSSPEELWSLLSATEQERFLKVINDPTSDAALQLLSSEELEREGQLPWWEAPHDLDERHRAPVKNYGAKPKLVCIPPSLIKELPTGTPLVYNVCAILTAYAYSTRHLRVCPLGNDHSTADQDEARNLILRLTPFLADRKSTLLFTNLSSVVTDIWSRLGTENVTAQTLSVLLRDVCSLIRPRAIIDVSQMPSSIDNADLRTLLDHPHVASVLALSDLMSLFEAHATVGKSSRKTGNPSRNHITEKLKFYAGQILSTPSFVLDSLSTEIEIRAKTMGRDKDFRSTAVELRLDEGSSRRPSTQTYSRS